MSTSNMISAIKYTIAVILSMVMIVGCDSGDSTSTSTNPGSSTSTVNTDADTGGQPVEDPVVVDNDLLSAECSLDQKKRWVDANMRDDYLFYDRVPVVNLDDYDSEESLLDALRVLPEDEYSYITDLESSVDYLEQGMAYAFGFRYLIDNAGLARISRVHTDSPVGLAGVTRGDIIETVNGVEWVNISSDQFNELTSNPSTWLFTDATDGTQFELILDRAEYRMNTVLHYQTITNGEYEGVIGYLALEQFLLSSTEELNTVMDFFREQQITDLVLDLRYNNSGLVSVGKQLASQLTGPATDGKIFAKYRYNDKYTEDNYDLLLESEIKNLGLNRLAVLTTESTVTVSEMVINGLRPYIPVTLIGDNTKGRSIISNNRDKCDKRLNIPVVETFNANDASVAGGLVAQCAATDDLSSELGLDDQTGKVEGMLRSALDFLVYGTCNAPTNSTSKSGSRRNKELDKQEYAPRGVMDIQ